MNKYTIVVQDDKSQKEVMYEFTGKAEYLKKLEEINGQYFVLQEATFSRLVVAKMPDLFNQQ